MESELFAVVGLVGVLLVDDLKGVGVTGEVGSVKGDGVRLAGDIRGKGVDGLEVVRGAALQQNGDRALSARPGKLEGLAGLGVDGNVGELDCVGSGREGGKNNGGVALHFE